MLNAKVITKIEANPILSKHTNENAMLRVAAYCRVSTDSEDQLESYKAQVAYYTDTISKNPRWKFVNIYADEGITGTLALKRENFMRMIRDCKKGKIDLILTKSVARFARNTVDSLMYVRQLKALGIGVYFEEQHLDSLKTDSEMMIGFHSVMAQAESENISANVRWGIQQRMKSGTFAFRYNLLGYKKGADGTPVIVEEEAETIRRIYQMYLDGNSIDQIKVYLESHGIKTATGKSVWTKSNIYNILANERYSGDMLLQKTYTENCITKKVKKNRGEMAKYLITNNHPAIVDRDTFKRVQMELAKRANKRKTSDNAKTDQGKYSGKYALTDLLVCGECGSPYRRRTWKIGGVSCKVWRCLSRVEHGTKFCKESINIEETKLHKAILRGLNKAMEDKQEAVELIISNLLYGVTGEDEVLDAYAIEKQIEENTRVLNETIAISLRSQGDKGRFEEGIKKLSDKIVALRNQLDLVRIQMNSKESVRLEIEELKRTVLNEEVKFDTFDETKIRRLVEYIKVMGNNTLIITLKGGLQIEEKIK